MNLHHIIRDGCFKTQNWRLKATYGSKNLLTGSNCICNQETMKKLFACFCQESMKNEQVFRSISKETMNKLFSVSSQKNYLYVFFWGQWKNLFAGSCLETMKIPACLSESHLILGTTKLSVEIPSFLLSLCCNVIFLKTSFSNTAVL